MEKLYSLDAVTGKTRGFITLKVTGQATTEENRMDCPIYLRCTADKTKTACLNCGNGCEIYKFAVSPGTQRSEVPCEAPGYVPTGNGKNKRFIVLTCEYEVYDTEWNEIARLITDVLPADFSAVSVRVEGT